MNIRALILFAVIGISHQAADEVISEIVHTSEIVTREEVLENLKCLMETCFGKNVSFREFNDQVLSVIEGGIDENVQYVEYFKDKKVKFVFWRTKERVHGNYYRIKG